MPKSRILLFCHDGTGLGHLRRISRLARSLQEHFSTLVLSGMREAGWIVPQECGLVKLPDWEGIYSRRAKQVGKVPWLDLPTAKATEFRAGAIREIARLYRPQAIIVDYLPFGQRRELDALFSSRDSLRYFLHRGLSDKSDSWFLRGAATKALADAYDRILIASDRRLGDVAVEDEYCDEARAKLAYVGFVAPEVISRGADWSPSVVCSGGGGAGAEELMLACLGAAERNPRIPFKIVLGPRSRLSASSLSVPPNCEVYGTREDLPALHQTASVVVSSGGYNSVLEAALGGARLIVYPNQTGDDDEQRRFAEHLSRQYPVHRLGRLDGLESILRAMWSESIGQPAYAFPLDIGGAERVRALVAGDLARRATMAQRA